AMVWPFEQSTVRVSGPDAFDVGGGDAFEVPRAIAGIAASAAIRKTITAVANRCVGFIVTSSDPQVVSVLSAQVVSTPGSVQR
ncbi:MAG: hypothetical protein AMS22_15825, partial [Thiotrichales bacterium SG8_50]